MRTLTFAEVGEVSGGLYVPENTSFAAVSFSTGFSVAAAVGFYEYGVVGAVGAAAAYTGGYAIGSLYNYLSQ